MCHDNVQQDMMWEYEKKRLSTSQIWNLRGTERDRERQRETERNEEVEQRTKTDTKDS